MRPSSVLLPLVLTALLALPSLARAQVTDVQFIAADGMPVSGSLEVFDFERTASPPAVNREGQVAFIYGIGDDIGQMGPALFLRVGAETFMLTAPESSLSSPITGFEPEINDSLYDSLTISDSGMVYLLATVDEQSGLWRIRVDLMAEGEHDSEVTPIAVTGDLSPSGLPWVGIGGTAGGGDRVTYRVNSRDSVLFFANDGATEGLYLRTDEGTTLVAARYAPAPGAPSQVFTEFRDFFLSDSDLVTFRASTEGGEGGLSGLWSWQDGVLNLRQTPVNEDDAISGDIIIMNPPYVSSPNGYVAFPGYRYVEEGDRSVYSVYLMDPVSEPLLVHDVDSQIGGYDVNTVRRIAVSNDGDVAIVVDVYGEGDTPETLLAIGKSRGSFEVVAAEGSNAPGGGVFEAFDHPTFNTRGDLAFTAEVLTDLPESTGVYWVRSSGLEAVLPAGAVLPNPAGGDPLIASWASFYGFNRHNRVFGDDVLCFFVGFTNYSSGALACRGLPEAEITGALSLQANVEVQPGTNRERAQAATRQPDYIYSAYLEPTIEDVPTWRLTATFSEPIGPVDIEPTILGAENVEHLCVFNTDQSGQATTFECDQGDSDLSLLMGVAQPFEFGVAVQPEGYTDQTLTVHIEASGQSTSGTALEATPIELVTEQLVADLEISVTGTDPLILTVRNNGPDGVNEARIPLSDIPSDQNISESDVSNRCRENSAGIQCDIPFPFHPGSTFDLTFASGAIEAYIFPDCPREQCRDPDETNNYLSVNSSGVPIGSSGAGADGLCNQLGYSSSGGNGQTLVFVGALLLLALGLSRRRSRKPSSSAAREQPVDQSPT